MRGGILYKEIILFKFLYNLLWWSDELIEFDKTEDDSNKFCKPTPECPSKPEISLSQKIFDVSGK